MREKEIEQLKRFGENHVKLVKIVSDQATKFVTDSYGIVPSDVYSGMKAVLNVVINCVRQIEELTNEFIDKEFGGENV